MTEGGDREAGGGDGGRKGKHGREEHLLSGRREERDTLKGGGRQGKRCTGRKKRKASQWRNSKTCEWALH